MRLKPGEKRRLARQAGPHWSFPAERTYLRQHLKTLFGNLVQIAARLHVEVEPLDVHPLHEPAVMGGHLLLQPIGIAFPAKRRFSSCFREEFGPREFFRMLDGLHAGIGSGPAPENRSSGRARQLQLPAAARPARRRRVAPTARRPRPRRPDSTAGLARHRKAAAHDRHACSSGEALNCVRRNSIQGSAPK